MIIYRYGSKLLDTNPNKGILSDTTENITDIAATWNHLAN